MDHLSPPRWVLERAKCDVDLIFEALSQVVRRDVEDANTLPGSRTFRVTENGDGVHPLLRVSDEGDPDSRVTFELTSAFISIHLPGELPVIVMPQWDAGVGKCRLYVNDQAYEVWQISQRVLMGLFLRIISDGNQIPSFS